MADIRTYYRPFDQQRSDLAR